MKRILNVWPLAVLSLLIFVGGASHVCRLAIGADATPSELVDVNVGTQGSASETRNPGLNDATPSALSLPVSGRMGLVAIIVPLLIAFVKPRLPLKWRKYVPLLAPILGEIITQLFTALPNGVGAVGGLAGVGVREAVKKKEVVAVLAILLLAVGATGCASLEKAALRPEVTIVTNVVERLVVQTNTIPIAVAVPGETIIKTNFVERVVTNEVAVLQTQVVTNFVVKPEIAEALQAGRTGAAVAGVFNPGAGAIASGVLGIATAGLGFWAARKNKDAKAAQAQLTAAIKGVEQLDPVVRNQAKERIAEISKIMGVSDVLHATVQDLTKAKI